MKFLKFLSSRLLTYIFVILLGMTIVFFVPRFMPSDPVESMLGQMMSKSSTMDAAAIEAMRKTLNENFGLEGTLGEQYFGYIVRDGPKS